MAADALLGVPWAKEMLSLSGIEQESLWDMALPTNIATMVRKSVLSQSLCDLARSCVENMGLNLFRYGARAIQKETLRS